MTAQAIKRMTHRSVNVNIGLHCLTAFVVVTSLKFGETKH